MSQYDVNLREYWRVIRKRKTVIILVTLLVAVGSYAFSRFQEPEPVYRAESSVKIEQENDLSFIRSAGYWMQAESMDTHAYTIISFPVLQQAAVKMGWIPKSLTSEEIRNNREYVSTIDRLKTMVSTEVKPHTSIINIQVTAREPDEAALIANTLAAAYREFNILQKNQRTLEMKAFIENHLEVLSVRLNDAEKNLRDFQNEQGMYRANQKTQEIRDRISRIQNSLQETAEEKAAVATQLVRIADAAQSAEKSLQVARQIAQLGKDSPIAKIGGKLESLLSERQQLLSRYRGRHPAVADVNDRIHQIINDAPTGLEMYLETLKARRSTLESQIIELQEQASRLPEKEHKLAKLELEATHQARLYSELQSRHQDTLIQESGKLDFVTLVKPAFPPSRPVNIPSNMMIVVTGLILGLLLGLVFAFGVEMFDTSIGTIEDIESFLGVPVLGLIPHLGGGSASKETDSREITQVERWRDLVVHYDSRSLAAEAFRSLRTSLQFVKADQKNKTFLVTSAFVKEGKTLNAVNLALSIAQAGRKVLIIDADLRRTTVHKVFGVPRTPGLTEYVLGDYQWQDVVSTITDVMLGDFSVDDILKTPGLDNLHILTAGTRPPNPTEILSSARFKALLEEAAGEYHYILIDSPPVLPVADPAEIAPLMDGVILVYTAGQIARGVLKRAKSTLDNIDATVIGVILNNVRPEQGPDYFKYHTYYYYGPDSLPEPKRRSAISRFFQSRKIG